MNTLQQPPVHGHRPAPDELDTLTSRLFDLSARDMRSVLNYIAGYRPDAFTAGMAWLDDERRRSLLEGIEQ